MPRQNLGRVKGDKGVSMRSKGSWTPSTAYVNNSQYIDIVTYGGDSYSCKASHTSGATFVSENWNLVAQKGAKGDKGNTGNTPTIQAGIATSLASNATPTVTSTTSGDITTFSFGIPKGDTSKFESPAFDDTVSTYTALNTANAAAETASNAIKSKVSIFTTLSNIKKSFSAIVQGLKILATNVGMIQGITSDLNSESDYIAASSKALATLNGNLGYEYLTIESAYLNTRMTIEKSVNTLRLHYRGSLKAAIENASTVTLCTLSEPFRPAIQLSKDIMLRHNHGLYANITIMENGEAKLLAYQAIPANITLFIDETFVTNKP